MAKGEESRTETIKCRVTVEELMQIDEKVCELKTTRSDFLRRVALENNIVIFDFSALDTLSAQIGKIGVNINQIARKLNQGETMDRDNAQYLVASMDTIQLMLGKIYEDTMKQKENSRHGSDGN